MLADLSPLLAAPVSAATTAAGATATATSTATVDLRNTFFTLHPPCLVAFDDLLTARFSCRSCTHLLPSRDGSLRSCPRKGRQRPGAQAVGIGDHQRECADHLCAVSELAEQDTDPLSGCRQRVPLDRLPDAPEQRL